MSIIDSIAVRCLIESDAVGLLPSSRSQSQSYRSNRRDAGPPPPPACASAGAGYRNRYRDGAPAGSCRNEPPAASPPGSGGRSSRVEVAGHHCPAPLSPGIYPYFGSNSLLNSFDFKKLRSSLELASWITILAFFPPGATPGEHRVAHPSLSTQVAMHPPVQVIVHVGWSSIVHVDA